MLSNVNQSSLYFKSQSVRDEYAEKIGKNNAIAQAQNNLVIGNVQTTTTKQIPIQGTGQKLNVIA